MPFVRNIILIVARESQVPDWIDTNNVRIVYHKDFIPKEFLPTFNSCTIESFLYNIPDISDRFLYFNDDMFALNLISVNDLFTGSKPNIKFLFHDSYNKANIYRCHCRNGLDLVSTALNVDKYPAGKLMCPEHSVAPMLSSTLYAIRDLCDDKIKRTISKVRMPYNINQYIYSYYQYFTNNYVDSICNYMYLEIKDSLVSVRNALFSKDIQILCLNDSEKIKNYKQTKDELLKIFEERFPDKCKYEM